jgi:large conductance mechanosensitive channel
MLKGFKDFLLRGNVIDLSVAVVMGAAFGGIVTAFTDKIIKPLLNAITPPSSPGFGVQLISGKASTFIDFAAVVTTAINFAMVAVVVYFAIVLPMRTIQERRKRGEEPGPAEPTDVELLKEIRDLLKAQSAASADGGRHAQHGTDTPVHASSTEPELFTQPQLSSMQGTPPGQSDGQHSR